MGAPPRLHRGRGARHRSVGAPARDRGQGRPGQEYDPARARRDAMAGFANWVRGRDTLLTPTLPITAIAVDEVDEATSPLATFTRVANYVGACALSLPAGFSPTGLPVGVRLSARRSPTQRSCASAHVPGRDRLAAAAPDAPGPVAYGETSASPAPHVGRNLEEIGRRRGAHYEAPRKLEQPPCGSIGGPAPTRCVAVGIERDVGRQVERAAGT